MRDEFNVYTIHEAGMAEQGAQDPVGGDRIRKYGPYPVDGLWDRWGPQGRRVTVWKTWRNFKVPYLLLPVSVGALGMRSVRSEDIDVNNVGNVLLL